MKDNSDCSVMYMKVVFRLEKHVKVDIQDCELRRQSGFQRRSKWIDVEVVRPHHLEKA